MISFSRPPATAALGIVLAAALSLSACRTDDGTAASTTSDAASDTTVSTSEPTTAEAGSDGSTTDDPDAGDVIDPAELATLVDNVDEAYRTIDGVWEGFRPNDHPVVLGWRDGADELIGAVAFNHPGPDALGTTTEIDATGRSFGSAHLITEVADDAADILDELQTFEFERTVGGADSFLMVAGGADGFFDPTTKDYGATLLHELFHRYQAKVFIGDGGLQDVEGYAYTAENLELAALEERALTVAVEAETEDERETAARHAAAVRLNRRAADDRVVLDDDQERFEGTARYIEHRLGEIHPDYLFRGDNYALGFVADPSQAGGVKDHYGFGRFYGSGAAVMKLLDDVGADDPTGKVEGGEYPMTLLAAELEVTDDDVERLVAEARLQYDPLGQLPDAAAEAAGLAAEEPPVFDDAGADGEAVVGSGDTNEDEIITDEELACLEENGVSLDEDGTEIPQAAVEACFETAGNP